MAKILKASPRTQQFLRAGTVAVVSTLVLAAGLGIAARPAVAAVPEPTIQETARLLGYLWGDGAYDDGVWDVNGPSGTSTLIEDLVEAHGGTWVSRAQLRFRLPAQYAWTDWKHGLPGDSTRVRNAVLNPHFLAAVLETEASVDGQIYDQSRCCVPGYTRGRLTELRDMMRTRGFSTATLVEFNNVDSGKVTIAASEWAELRGAHRFACPVSQSAIRIPGGTNLATYGNLRWIQPGERWGDVVRGDCRIGSAVPAPTEQAGSCSVSATGDRVTVQWTFTLGDISIREDNTFVTSESGRDGSWTATRTPGQHSYEIRLFAFGIRTDVNCGTVVVGDDTPPQGPCTVAASGAGVQLTWDDFGKSSYSVRRNGGWLATITGGSTTSSQAGSLADQWEIRYRNNGVVIDVPCTTGANPPPDAPCNVTSRNGGVRIAWDGIAGVSTYQVRRNGGWLATVAGATSYDHSNGALANDYTIRYRKSGSTFDLICN